MITITSTIIIITSTTINSTVTVATILVVDVRTVVATSMDMDEVVAKASYAASEAAWMPECFTVVVVVVWVVVAKEPALAMDPECKLALDGRPIMVGSRWLRCTELRWTPAAILLVSNMAVG